MTSRSGSFQRGIFVAGAFAVASALAWGCDSQSSGVDADLPPCASSNDCDDGVFCNGAERCVEDACVPAASGPCGGLACDEGARSCEPGGEDASTGMDAALPVPDAGAMDGAVIGADAATMDAATMDAATLDDAGSDAGPHDAGPPDAGPPPDCSTVTLTPGNGVTTGSSIASANFYVTGSSGAVRSCWVEFLPRFTLWTDGLVKRRWVYLPPGAQIRSSGSVAVASGLTASLSLDRWHFPVGTRFMKEFALPSGRRVETRIWERLPDVGGYPVYRMGSFRWSNITGTGAQVGRYTESGSPATMSEPNAIQVTIDGETFVHQIPNNAACHRCHDGEPGRGLGFSAFQLTKDTPDDVSLITLITDGRLTSTSGYNPGWRFPIDDITYDPTAPAPPTREAIGALHANCGHCHNSWSQAEASYIDTAGLSVPSGFELRLRYGQGYVSSSQPYRSTVDRAASFPQLGQTLRIASGAPDESILWLRDGLRAGMVDGAFQMPPLGTARVNEPMQTATRAWIRALP